MREKPKTPELHTITGSHVCINKHVCLSVLVFGFINDKIYVELKIHLMNVN